MSIQFTEAPAADVRKVADNPYAPGIALGNAHRDKSFGHTITAKSAAELDAAIKLATGQLRRAAADAGVTARIYVTKDEKGISADFRFIVKDRETRTRKPATAE